MSMWDAIIRFEFNGVGFLDMTLSVMTGTWLELSALSRVAPLLPPPWPLSAPPVGAFSSPWSGEGRAWPQMTGLLSSVVANLEERENVPFLGPNLSPVGQDSDRPGWGLSPPGHWPGRNWSCAPSGPSSRNTSVLTRKRVGLWGRKGQMYAMPATSYKIYFSWYPILSFTF